MVTVPKSYIEKITDLWSFYSGIQSYVRDNLLNDRINTALAPAQDIRADERTFVEARRLVNEAWLVYVSRFELGMANYLLKLNSHARTEAEQSGLLYFQRELLKNGGIGFDAGSIDPECRGNGLVREWTSPGNFNLEFEKAKEAAAKCQQESLNPEIGQAIHMLRRSPAEQQRQIESRANWPTPIDMDKASKKVSTPNKIAGWAAVVCGIPLIPLGIGLPIGRAGLRKVRGDSVEESGPILNRLPGAVRNRLYAFLESLKEVNYLNPVESPDWRWTLSIEGDWDSARQAALKPFNNPPKMHIEGHYRTHTEYKIVPKSLDKDYRGWGYGYVTTTEWVPDTWVTERIYGSLSDAKEAGRGVADTVMRRDSRLEQWDAASEAAELEVGRLLDNRCPHAEARIIEDFAMVYAGYITISDKRHGLPPEYLEEAWKAIKKGYVPLPYRLGSSFLHVYAATPIYG